MKEMNLNTTFAVMTHDITTSRADSFTIAISAVLKFVLLTASESQSHVNAKKISHMNWNLVLNWVAHCSRSDTIFNNFNSWNEKLRNSVFWEKKNHCKARQIIRPISSSNLSESSIYLSRLNLVTLLILLHRLKGEFQHSTYTTCIFGDVDFSFHSVANEIIKIICISEIRINNGNWIDFVSAQHFLGKKSAMQHFRCWVAVPYRSIIFP